MRGDDENKARHNDDDKTVLQSVIAASEAGWPRIILLLTKDEKNNDILRNMYLKRAEAGGILWRQKTQAPTPQAPDRNRQTRKVANAKVRIG